jgi:hypothetical protein
MSMGEAEVVTPWVLVDDGTGRNVMYHNTLTGKVNHYLTIVYCCGVVLLPLCVLYVYVHVYVYMLYPLYILLITKWAIVMPCPALPCPVPPCLTVLLCHMCVCIYRGLDKPRQRTLLLYLRPEKGNIFLEVLFIDPCFLLYNLISMQSLLLVFSRWLYSL